MPGEKPDPAARGFGQGYEYVAVSFAFAFAILLFGAGGWVVDGWLHTRPLFAIVGAFLGGFAGFMNLYYRVQRDTQTRKPERDTRNGQP